MKFVDVVEKIKETLKNAVFPEDVTCDICGNELVADTRYHLCGECIEKLSPIKGKICLDCGVPMANEADYCLRCQTSDFKFVMNRAPLVYDGEARRLVYKFKFGGKQYISHTLGAMMSDTFIRNGMKGEIVVFVPMTEDEERKRGFNQSELLALDIGKRLNLPVLPALAKVRSTSEQKELGGKERAKNIEGVFALKQPEVKDRIILLVDDVFTTGATANECAKVLLKGKAKAVYVLTAAVTKQKLPAESGNEETGE